MNTPKDLKYSRDHEWVKVEGAIATVGITDFAQSQLGDVVFVDLPEEGAEVVAGQEFCAIESVKAVSDVYAPVSGIIREVNANLADAPETVNQDAYGEGWIVKIELKNESEAEQLLDAGEYEALCAKEGH
ncbi:MAG: glycine cleavage system protein GcvH [Acidaminococcales bacterium]|jgi:glycine cleavage system H protein|nr:glycine cleavage system protein GcvH [Acidaminococcales bacterium]